MRVAVLVNDVGAVNLDEKLIRESRLVRKDEKLVEMTNGCICCNRRDDLLKTVRELAAHYVDHAAASWAVRILDVAAENSADDKPPRLRAVLAVSLGASLATGVAGLSPIVGALIAGLLIAETDFHGEVEAIIEPFKGLALGIFLITVGMSIDLQTISPMLRRGEQSATE